MKRSGGRGVADGGEIKKNVSLPFIKSRDGITP